MKKISAMIVLSVIFCFMAGCHSRTTMAEFEESKAQATLEDRNKALFKSTGMAPCDLAWKIDSGKLVENSDEEGTISFPEKNVEEVKDACDKIIKLYTTLDTKGLIEMCADDFMLVGPDASIKKARGKESLRELFVEGMKEFESLEIEYDIRKINRDGNLAYVLLSNNDKYKFFGSDETIVLDNCQTLMVFERQNDGLWKMKLQMCVVPNDEQN